MKKDIKTDTKTPLATEKADNDLKSPSTVKDAYQNLSEKPVRMPHG